STGQVSRARVPRSRTRPIAQPSVRVRCRPSGSSVQPVPVYATERQWCWKRGVWGDPFLPGRLAWQVAEKRWIAAQARAAAAWRAWEVSEGGATKANAWARRLQARCRSLAPMPAPTPPCIPRSIPPEPQAGGAEELGAADGLVHG